MIFARQEIPTLIVITVAGIAAPLAFPAFTTQFAFLWIMVVFAMTWDVTGGQMGYNSFGNVVFFGLGMYVCAVVQVAPSPISPNTTRPRGPRTSG